MPRRMGLGPPIAVLAEHRLWLVSRDLAHRKASLESLSHEVGCDADRFAEQPVPHFKAPNLVCTSRRNRFVGEERGLLGSHEYVKKLPPDEARRIRAFINSECLGLGPAKVWASRADPGLLNAFALIPSALHVGARGLNVDSVGDDDPHLFLDAGIPVITIHSPTQDTFRVLHTPRDNLKAIHPDDYHAAYRLIAPYLAYLDGNAARCSAALQPALEIQPHAS